MLYNNNISILRKPAFVEEEPPPPTDYYILLNGDGYIEIDVLNQFLDYRNDFLFNIEFKIRRFDPPNYLYLINSCFDIHAICGEGSNEEASAAVSGSW